MKVWDMYKPVVHDQLVTLGPKGGYVYQGESVTYDTLNVYTDRIEIATINTKRRSKR